MCFFSAGNASPGRHGELREDVGEGAVDLVRHARGERADGGHPLGLHEARLHLLAFGQITRDAEDRRRAVVVDDQAHDLGVDGGSVAPEQPVLLRRDRPAVLEIGVTLLLRGALVGVHGVSHEAPDELPARS